MKRKIDLIIEEIGHQIFYAELCFDICTSMEIIPGRGSDFYPFYYNLNFIKGLISLHSIIESKGNGELSIKNLLDKYEREWPERSFHDFREKFKNICSKHKNIFPIPLRHKIAAHIDEAFDHTDFACAYILPNHAKKLLDLTLELKELFFEEFDFCYPEHQPFHRIKEQSMKILKQIK